MGFQLTPGQKCILDLLQRKLLTTILAYRELSLRRLDVEKRCLTDIATDKARSTTKSSNSGSENTCNSVELNLDDKIDEQLNEISTQLWKLQAKIKRISARQKRFTNEILNGNGNNTIPKENYFQALGLITKDVLDRINLKSCERRRRTTANPRFSHEAIQAKRALEHHSQSSSQQSTRSSNRIEDRIAKGLATRASAADKYKNSNNSRKGRDKSEPSNNQNSGSNNNKPVNGTKTTGSTNNSSQPSSQVANKNGNGRSNGRNKNNNATSKSKSPNSTDKILNKTNSNTTKRNLLDGAITSCLSDREKQQLQNQFRLLQWQIFSKISQINEKRDSNKRLEEENEAVRKRGLDMMSALNEYCQDRTKFAGLNNANSHNADIPLNLVKSGGNSVRAIENMNSNTTSNGKVGPPESYEIWLNLKCDESLEGIESSDNLCER